MVKNLSAFLISFLFAAILFSDSLSADMYSESEVIPETQNFLTEDIPNGAAFIHYVIYNNNQLSNSTELNHHLANDNPTAKIFVSLNYNPAESSGIGNNHPVAVRYDNQTGRWSIFNQDGGFIENMTAFNVFIFKPEPIIGILHPGFTHTATAVNTTGAITEIDYPLVNGNANAILQVTQNWNPGGFGEVDNNHIVGVRYNRNSQRWAIFNQDGSAIPDGASFNVLALVHHRNAFVHSVSEQPSIAQNQDPLTKSWTELDHVQLNGHPNAIFHVTHNWNPLSDTGIDNDHIIGVRYDQDSQRWAIYNQDDAPLPNRASFNVFLPIVRERSFNIRATVSNLNFVEIDHPLTNDNPNAIVQATHNFSVVQDGEKNNSYIGVLFNAMSGKWAVINQNLLTIEKDTGFNIFVPSTLPNSASFIHTATVNNLNGSTTEIDHPLANDKPNAKLFVTQNFTPNGDYVGHNDHPVTVWYNSQIGRWLIFNQDNNNILEGTAFNVYISPPEKDSSSFVHSVLTQNLGSFRTVIDHPLANGNQSAILQVTQNLVYEGNGGIQNEAPIGVQYLVSGKWAIFNQDFSIMPEGAFFNVDVLGSKIIQVNLEGGGSGIVRNIKRASEDEFIIDCGEDCDEVYPEGWTMSLEAEPAEGSIFAGWGGACSGTGECEVLMNASKTVTAIFEKEDVTIEKKAPLQISLTGNGSGVVSSDPAGINCGDECNLGFEPESFVTLIATPDTSSTFVGWGGKCSGVESCTVQMGQANEPTYVTATFVSTDSGPGESTGNLLVSRLGDGAGYVTGTPAGIDCGTECSAQISLGIIYSLIATPDPGSTFSGWSGDCSGTATCVIEISELNTVIATFTAGSEEPSEPESGIYLPLIYR